MVFPEVPENGRNLRTMIREKMMEMFRNKEQSIEETLLESFYILLELYQAEQEDTLSEERIENYFSREAVKELKTAILAIDLPFLDTMDECNELLSGSGCQLSERRSVSGLSDADPASGRAAFRNV